MVTVYYKENCGQCMAVKRFLDAKKIPYQTEFISEDRYGEIREKFQVEALPVTEFSAPYTTGFVVGGNMAEIGKYLKTTG